MSRQLQIEYSTCHFMRNIRPYSVVRPEKYDWNRKQDVIITRRVRFWREPQGGGIEVASHRLCRIRSFPIGARYNILLYIFNLLYARPTVLHTTSMLNGHLDTGVPPAALVHNIIIYTHYYH